MEGVAKVSIEERTDFSGYEHLDGNATVLSLVAEDTETESISEGSEALVILDTTPFYAESGGQVGDKGFLTWPGGRFEVSDVHFWHTRSLPTLARWFPVRWQKALKSMLK